MTFLVLRSLVFGDGARQALAILRDLARSRMELVAKNALLRQQLLVLRRHVRNPRLQAADRWWIVAAARVT